ncbi:GNAT family N-acetyltransferase [Halobacillus sp. A5]|uniref:GNAT family N-acetyltransferase n=1 Tax=Halobacillus sp. A5 TaxID=2880263 RepID=UPI0020A68D7D|nr:GNAT family N-acetyltransferase [Halobacillus sp. A5]MCP3027893.1 GNAT family N-acetyltransferase [Halobacillus sp. A5]
MVLDYLRPTPWDVRNFHIDTFEVMSLEEEALLETDEREGHYTIKIEPFDNPKRLLEHGFYYVDTLIEPVCERNKLNMFDQEGTMVSTGYDRASILTIAEETFAHGRFHRDFNIPNEQADQRYMNWVSDLIDKEQIYALKFNEEIAGFYGFEKENVLLLGMSKNYRHKGLAKAFTSQACRKHMEDSMLTELRTSVSAANVASLNLFHTLGFRLESAKDIYHKLNRRSSGR